MSEESQPELSPVEDAREQADEFGGFARSGKVKDETGKEYTFPSLLLLSDKQQEAYDELQHTLNHCDRWPDRQIPKRMIKQTDPDGTVTETTVEAHTVPGDFMSPYEKDGERIKPAYSIAIAQILLGKQYEEFEKNGGKSAELVEELKRMQQRTAERQAADSKSVGSGEAGS
jgi:hypothetical protein